MSRNKISNVLQYFRVRDDVPLFIETGFEGLVPVKLANSIIKSSSNLEPEEKRLRVQTYTADTVASYADYLRWTAGASLSEIHALFQFAHTSIGNLGIFGYWKELDALWALVGDYAEIARICNEFFETDFALNPQSRPIWLIAITSALETGDTVRANMLIDNYVTHFGNSWLEQSLPVASYCIQNGIDTEAIAIAAEVSESLAGSYETICSIFEGATVAIVGSGPQEIGKCKGAEIDAHDLVVRFNDCFDCLNVADYGKKTNVWVKNLLAGSNESHVSPLDLIILEPNRWHIRFAKKGYITTAHQYITYYNKRIANLEYDFDMIREIDAFPTTGAWTINTLARMRGIKSIDYYGFSFLDNSMFPSLDHHSGAAVSNDESKMHHRIDRECIYLRKLIGRELG